MKTIKSGVIGILIANTIFNLMALFFTDNIIQLYIVTSMALGLITGLATAIYSFEKLPLLARTSIHALISYIAFLGSAYVGKWFPFYWEAILSGTIIFGLIFIVIWSIFYVGEKRNIKQINSALIKKN